MNRTSEREYEMLIPQNSFQERPHGSSGTHMAKVQDGRYVRDTRANMNKAVSIIN